MAEAFLVRQDLDERTELEDACDRAREDFADLDLADDVVDHLLRFRHALGIVRGDEDVTVLMDVDIDARRIDDAAHDLATRADDVADLVRLDRDGLDARRIGRELLRGLADAFEHLAEDERAAALRLLERRRKDVAREAVDLDVHLDGRDALARACDLEIHVAERVFHALDIREDRVLVPFFDEAHGNAGNRALDRYACIHERERAAADGCLRARTIRFEDFGNEAHGVRKFFDGRHDRHESALGESAVADFAAAGAAHRACLADAVAGEVVVMDVMLRRLGAKAVNDLLVTERTERRDGQHLRLAAREERRAMRARQEPHLAGNRADFLDAAAVRADFFMRDHVTDNGLLEVVERHGDFLFHFGIVRQEMLSHIGRNRADMGVAVELVGIARRLVEALARIIIDSGREVVRHGEEMSFHLLLAAGALDFLFKLDDALDFLVAEEDGVEDDVLGELVRAGLDHHDGIVRARDREVQRRNGALRLGRVDDEFIIDAADAHACNRPLERDVGNGERRARANHGRDFRRVVLLDRKHGRDDLHVVAEPFRKQRTDRSVDEARAERRVARWASLALDEAARNLARRIHLFLVIDGQRKEIDAFARFLRCRGRHEHDRIAITHEHGAVRLLRHLAVLDDELSSAHFHFKGFHDGFLQFIRFIRSIIVFL